MKRVVTLLFVFGLAALTARAQTVTGNGTTNTIPEFTSSTTIGNSPIVDFNGRIGIGTATARFPLDIFGGFGTPSPSFGGPILVLGELRDSTNNAVAMEGLASATTGNVTGVSGTTYSPAGVGVFGTHAAFNNMAGGGGGVFGLTTATSGFAFGVRGDAIGTTSSAIGVFGQSFSRNGFAAHFANRPGGNIIVGVVSENPDRMVFRVDGNGTVFAN